MIADDVRRNLERADRGAAYLDARSAGTLSHSAIVVTQDVRWPNPQPLLVQFQPEPYPMDALPETIRAAVEEVQGFTKAPVPLVAASALSALSLAVQALYDVKRAERLQGPTGIFLLTIADSGERKSTCDGFFMEAIRDFERVQADNGKIAVAKYVADTEAWTAKRDGVKARIREQAKAGDSSQAEEKALHELEQEKPKPPRVPKLLRGDDTPESLAFVLGCEYPSAGIVSSEAGAILGAHAMGKESIMRNLALLNILWDGGELPIGRRTSESFTVRGARLTVGLQVQEPTLRSFLDRSQGIVRGIGLLARMLVAWPESTQGSRRFSEAPSSWPALAVFNRRIGELLNRPVGIREDGSLSLEALTLSPEAKQAWIEFHDTIEAALRDGGELHDVRDVAAKAADNAARLAAMFHALEQDRQGGIGAGNMHNASRIVAWHVTEARRFFGELALPIELADALRLDNWLLAYCARGKTTSVGKNHVRQHGPLRDGARLDAAIRELDALERVRLLKEGKRLTIQINPTLLGPAS